VSRICPLNFFHRRCILDDDGDDGDEAVLVLGKVELALVLGKVELALVLGKVELASE
jgi:hypothetical protein